MAEEADAVFTHQSNVRANSLEFLDRPELPPAKAGGVSNESSSLPLSSHL